MHLLLKETQNVQNALLSIGSEKTFRKYLDSGVIITKTRKIENLFS